MIELTAEQFSLTRFLFQRLLAFLYFIGFFIAVQQFPGLSGSRGLLPVASFIKKIRFWEAPSLFWAFPGDAALAVGAWLGLGFSLVALSGLSDLYEPWLSALVWFLLWMLYLSFVNVGQTFYGFGWEMLLLETGFLAIFLGPARAAPSVIVLWLLRWALFRIMFGAGLIKIRGDSCWRDLTCLQYHYETQPLPGPFSWTFHHFPLWMHKGGVLFNHFVELVVPFGFFGPRPVRLAAGVVTILFQLVLILSGNLSWLNCITIVLTLSCFDDAFLAFFLKPLAAWLPATAATLAYPAPILYALALLLLYLSVKPTLNLISESQAMNASFEPLHLVNTYGAFGSITRERDELIVEGTLDPVITTATNWREYSFKAKPGDVSRRPPQVTPYHYKLDWQMWFAAMSPYYYHPWILHLVAKLLESEPAVLGLMGPNPFPEGPPAFVRVRSYRYHFTQPGEVNYWTRDPPEEYLPPLSLSDPAFRKILASQGWLDHDEAHP